MEAGQWIQKKTGGIAKRDSSIPESAGEGVGEQEHQSHNQAVDGQSFHEGQGEQQGAADLAFSFGLAGDPFHSLAGCGALANARTDGGEAHRESGGQDGGGGGQITHWWKAVGVAQDERGKGRARPGHSSEEEWARFHPDLRAKCLADRRGPAKG